MTRIFLIGDSTMSTYPEARYPRKGWGQVLQDYIPGAEIRNHAVPGRSTKSFYEQGHFEEVEELLQEGDFLFIQFGHNDSKKDDPIRFTNPWSDYQDNLKMYIDAAISKQARPILFTPVARRYFDESGNLIDAHGDYPKSMRKLAADLDIPLVDVTDMSETWLRKQQPEATKQFFMWLSPGEYNYYPDGSEDNTHFTEKGAHEIAKITANALVEKGIIPPRWMTV
ncbi:rhamnogalacturonan acetylesterase [Salipaludibacillus sp. CF4.18]|uniref:rhamnogalacturonan acetylesterase n=1 Tax=Salipaludibacillus sp. CF4.18 TaxID=3373081 RepID=UPI003EE573D7